ncbi:hypothetical protein Prudu_011725 [Prunus dulcis]|uniref:Uncharacterized protein n=1 Tax=Prunus dulcis TaxID=3755 RepID=A0A4Y1RBA2_PRUDU|nr:hypothetical protein Prudu_011725 [Prunus dulcis]
MRRLDYDRNEYLDRVGASKIMYIRFLIDHDHMIKVATELIGLHQNFVMGYLNSSSEMHRASYPFSDWEMEKLTKEVGLELGKEEAKAWPQEFETSIRFEDFQYHNPYYR